MVPLLACSPASRASIRRCARLRPTRPSASCASMKERIAVLLVPDASASKGFAMAYKGSLKRPRKEYGVLCKHYVQENLATGLIWGPRCYSSLY